MGTGANVTATLDEIQDNFTGKSELQIESFENDLGGLALTLQNLDRFPSLANWAQLLAQLLVEKDIQFQVATPKGQVQVRWRLWMGDFFSVYSEAQAPDLIYYDFYSPKAVPELWTKLRFQELRRFLGNRSTELLTYSAATPVRLALLLGGFFVGSGPRTSMKTETTVAATQFQLLKDPLDSRWRAKLDVSTSIEDHSDRSAGHVHPQWALAPSEANHFSSG
jgi:tRNA U34 5-methylaminomethyl-2-thiouridine-forming methyltransferase MnmC